VQQALRESLEKWLRDAEDAGSVRMR